MINLRADIIKTRENLKASYTRLGDFIKSIPQDIIGSLGEADKKIYKDLIIGPIQEMISQASRQDIELEYLRSKITNLL